nr:transposase [Victivallis vadensis]
MAVFEGGRIFTFRFVNLQEFNSFGPNNRFIVTNLEDDGHFFYEKVYCTRGKMENRIKEQQLGLFADRTSCHDFAANQVRLLLASLAYILMERFRTLLLNGTKLAQATCGRIRLFLVKIGAAIRRNTRKIYVALSSACPNQELLRLIVAKIIAME